MMYGKHTVETTYVEGEPTIKREKFEERIRVKNEKQELVEYMRFREEHSNDEDPRFCIERTPNGQQNGFYYVVMMWSIKVL